MEFPAGLKYTKDHEWAKVEGNKVTVGVTFHAQESLGDVVYVELPKEGDRVVAGQSFGVIESTKAVSELFSPAMRATAMPNVPWCSAAGPCAAPSTATGHRPAETPGCPI